MKLDTKAKRLWFVIWCIWSVGWLAAYVIGGFYVLRDCRLHLSQLVACQYDFKLGGFVFMAFILPLVAFKIASGISRIKSWVSNGS